MSESIQVTEAIAIPRSELMNRASRSGGAGGQHVNTSSTRIELLWPFEQSPALTDRRMRVAIGETPQLHQCAPRLAEGPVKQIDEAIRRIDLFAGGTARVSDHLAKELSGPRGVLRFSRVQLGRANANVDRGLRL